MRLKPAPTKASSNSNEVASSTVQPNTFPPKARGATLSPDLPSCRLIMTVTQRKAGLFRNGSLAPPPQATRSFGSRPAKNRSRFSATRIPMATRVSSVAPEVRQQHYVFQPEEGLGYARLVLIDIEAGACDHPVAQSLHQRGLIDDLASRGVDKK